MLCLSGFELCSRWVPLISIRETNCTIHWIEIYPVDSAIRLLSNWGLSCIDSPVSKSL